MKQRSGLYIPQSFGPKSYQSYVPYKLPPKNPPLDLTRLYPYLEKAAFELAQLNNMHKIIPNISLFIYMYVRKEALLSSQIEGTQSSFSDLILFEQQKKPKVSLEDVEEVSYYVQAIFHGLRRLKEGFPLSLRLLREIHTILLSGGRGRQKRPGEFRQSQNWIGGTRADNALFVPPPVSHLHQCLSDFESFLHDTSLPILIKAGLLHVQFETIHPFLDGNGRLGRLLIILLLFHHELLDEPILYLSLYLKKNRQIYYDLLQEVRLQGKWETWLEFFLEGISISSRQAAETITSINNIFDQDSKKIATLGRARFSCEQVFSFIKQMPQVTTPFIAQKLNLTPPTARSALQHMVELEILKEISGKKRDKIYTYHRYLTVLTRGTEPIKF